jgi:AcrR family transcriptional regulator
MPKVSQAHLAARRQQVIDAAVACFAREGFHLTTMQDIVRESGLSPGAIYSYFKSKEEIIEAIADERHARERALIATASAQPNAGAVLRALAQGFFGTLQDAEGRTQRRINMQIWAEALINPQLHTMVREGIDEPRLKLAGLIAEAQERGELPPHLVPDALARVMIALFQGFVLQQAWDEQADVASYVAVIEAMLDALLKQSTPRPPAPIL